MSTLHCVRGHGVDGCLVIVTLHRESYPRHAPLGRYNTWYDVGGEINQSYIETTAAAMAARGLVAVGYTHLNLDVSHAGRAPCCMTGAGLRFESWAAGRAAGRSGQAALCTALR